MAIANHRIPDTDPRKITREMVDAFGELVISIRNLSDTDLRNIFLAQCAVAALRALLPPAEGVR